MTLFGDPLSAVLQLMFDVHSNSAMNALANEAWSQQSTASMQVLLQPHMPASSNNLVQYEPSLNKEDPSQPPSEPKLSAYARWKLAEDEKFYTTFPEARYAADQYNTISSAYLVGTGYYYDEEGCIAMVDHQTLSSLSTASITHENNATGNEHPQIHEHEPRYDMHYADSALARALDPTSRDVRPRSSTSACHNTPPPTPPPQSDPQPTCPTQTIESSNLVPQVPQVASIPEPPIMDSLRPPDFPNMSLSPYNPIQNVAPNLPSKSEYTYHHPSAGYTDPSLYDMALYAFSSLHALKPTTSFEEAHRQEASPGMPLLPR
ncbi:hypothetical protein H0H93_003511 [Arthromyces matolae]|nr:hypothetical protein H0H93_003511 [Arthromyces matolae]